MAGYSSDDGDYYSDGGWGEQDNGGYYSDDHPEQQVGIGTEDTCGEQDDDEGSYDGNGGMESESEELNDGPGHQVEGNGVPGIVIVNPGQDGPQQTMTGSIGKQSGVDGGRHSVTSNEWSSGTRHQDKLTGDYARETAKHTFVSGDTFKERSTGRVGFKDEYKHSTTIAVGDKGGYSEYRLEERFRTIEFGKSSSSGSGSGSSLTNKKK